MPALSAAARWCCSRVGRSNAHEVWRVIEREIATRIVIVGDPFARPMLRALEERETAGQPYDTSNVRSITSSGAIWSSEIKDGLRTRMSAILIDTPCSTEGGSIGVSGAIVTSARRRLTSRSRPIRGSSPKTDTR